MIPAHISSAFAAQAAACGTLGSPFMAQLMRLFAENPWPAGPVRDRVFGWPGDITPAGQSLPLRLAGALHGLVLSGEARLSLVYPPAEVSDAALWQAVSLAVDEHAAVITRWLESPPQTNDVRRAAVLIALGHLLTAQFGLPIVTSELGASAGLNLHWDRYALRIGGQAFGPPAPVLTLQPDWSGPLPPAGAPPRLAACAGVDLAPLTPAAPADLRRLCAYLWPDQPDRQRLTRAAAAAAATVVTKGDAVDWLLPRLHPRPGHLHLIYSTVAWQYFPADKQRAGAGAIHAAGDKATPEAPLAWFMMEADGQTPGTALMLRLWPGAVTIPLGRADFHGRWVNWTPPEVLPVAA